MPKKYQVNDPKYQQRIIEKYHANNNLPSLFEMRTLGKLRSLSDFEKRLCQAILLLMIVHSVTGDNEDTNSEKNAVVKRKNVKYQGSHIGSMLPDLSVQKRKVRRSHKGMSKSSKRLPKNPKSQKSADRETSLILNQFKETLSQLETSSQQIIEAFIPYISLRCKNEKENFKYFLNNRREFALFVDIKEAYQSIDDYYSSIEINSILDFQTAIVNNLGTLTKKTQTKFYNRDMVAYDSYFQDSLNLGQMTLLKEIFGEERVENVFIMSRQPLEQIFKLYDEKSMQLMKQLIINLKDKVTNTLDEEIKEFINKIYNPVIKKADTSIVVDLSQIHKLTHYANTDQLAAIQEFEETWKHKPVKIYAIRKLYMFYFNSEFVVFESQLIGEIKNILEEKKQIISFTIKDNYFVMGKDGIFSEEEYNWYFELWGHRLQKLSEYMRALPNPFASVTKAETNSDLLLIDYQYDQSSKDSHFLEDKDSYLGDGSFKVSSFETVMSLLDRDSAKIVYAFIPYIELRLKNAQDNIEIAFAAFVENHEGASQARDVIKKEYEILLLNLQRRFELSIVKRVNELNVTSKKVKFRPNDMLYLEDWLNSQLNNAETAFYKNIFQNHLRQEGALWELRFEKFDNKLEQFDEESQYLIHRLLGETIYLIEKKRAKAEEYINKKYAKFLKPLYDTVEINLTHYLDQLRKQLGAESIHLLDSLEEKYPSANKPVKAIVEFYLAIIQHSFSKYAVNLESRIEKKLNEIKLTKVFDYDILFAFVNFGIRGIFTEQQFEWYLDLYKDELDQEFSMIKKLPELIQDDLSNSPTEASVLGGAENAEVTPSEEYKDNIEKSILAFLKKLTGNSKIPFIITLIFSFAVTFLVYSYLHFKLGFVKKDKDDPSKNKMDNNRRITSSLEETEHSGHRNHRQSVSSSSSHVTQALVRDFLAEAKNQLEVNFNAYDLAYEQGKSTIHRSRNYPETNSVGKITSLYRAKNELVKHYVNFASNDNLGKSYLTFKGESDQSKTPAIVDFNKKLISITRRIEELTQGMEISMSKQTIISNYSGKEKEKEQSNNEQRKGRTSKHDFVRKNNFINSPPSSSNARAPIRNDFLSVSQILPISGKKTDKKDQVINPHNGEQLCAETTESTVTMAPFLLKSKSQVRQPLHTKPKPMPAEIPNVLSLGKQRSSQTQTRKARFDPHIIKLELIKKMQTLHQRSTNQTDRYFPSEENKASFPFEVETGRRMCLYLFMKMSEAFSKDVSTENNEKIILFRNQIVHQHNLFSASDVIDFVTTFNARYELRSSKNEINKGRSALVYILNHSPLIVPSQKPKSQKDTVLPKSSGILLFDFVEKEENNKKIQRNFSELRLDLEYLQTVYQEKFLKRMQANEPFTSIFFYLSNHEPDLLEACEFTLVCIYEKLLKLCYNNNHDDMREAHPRLTVLRNKISHELPSLRLDEFREFFIDILPVVEETLNGNEKYNEVPDKKLGKL